MKYLQVLISSELSTQGLRLLEHLIRKRLIFGGPVLSGPARFLTSTSGAPVETIVNVSLINDAPCPSADRTSAGGCPG